MGSKGSKSSSLNFTVREGLGLNPNYIRLDSGDEIPFQIPYNERGSNRKLISRTPQEEHWTEEYVRVSSYGKVKYILTVERSTYEYKGKRRIGKDKLVSVRKA